MPKQHKDQRSARQHKTKSGHRSNAAISPAPMLYKERVVLTDVVPLAGNDQGGFFYSLAGPNGMTNLQFTDLIPQVSIWDQYAAMYQFYQVKHIGFKFVPYRIQGKATNDPKSTVVFNTLSIQSPVDSVPLVSSAPSPSAMFSFGNCMIKQGYDMHVRNMHDFTDLGLSKQNEIILKTNGSHQQRQQYVKPATMIMTGNASSFNVQLVGDFVYSITYEFSGRQSPLIATSLAPQDDASSTALSLVSTQQPLPPVTPTFSETAESQVTAARMAMLRAQLDQLSVRE